MVDRTFQEIDLNKDGTIDFPEFELAIQVRLLVFGSVACPQTFPFLCSATSWKSTRGWPLFEYMAPFTGDLPHL